MANKSIIDIQTRIVWWRCQALINFTPVGNDAALTEIQGELPNLGSLRWCFHYLSWLLPSTIVIRSNLKLCEIFEKNFFGTVLWEAPTRQTFPLRGIGAHALGILQHLWSLYTAFRHFAIWNNKHTWPNNCVFGDKLSGNANKVADWGRMMPSRGKARGGGERGGFPGIGHPGAVFP